MGVASAIRKEEEVCAIEKRAEKEERERDRGREDRERGKEERGEKEKVKEEKGEKGGERKKGSFIGRSMSQPKKEGSVRRVIK